MPKHTEIDDTKTLIKPQIRWLIRRDMPEVLDIEQSCYRTPWTEEDFLHWWRIENYGVSRISGWRRIPLCRLVNKSARAGK